MDERQRQLQSWSRGILGLAGEDVEWTDVAVDASTRRYFRLRKGSDSWICMDAPPTTEKNQAFIEVRALLATIGIRVPDLLGQQLPDGFLLLEDLGDQLLLGQLNADTADACYQRALDMLLILQTAGDLSQRVPAYSEQILAEELSRFSEWFLEGLLGLNLAVQEVAIIQAVAGQLIDSALAQPQTLVHLDFHSRNLLVLPGGELATIDFQDARWGPLCYDLVSLLKDCYIRWPDSQLEAWALQYRARLQATGQFAGEDEAQFLRWFDWMGLQRHIKVLGNFSRLAIRDGKPGYLQDIPRVLDYIVPVLRRYAQFSQMLQLLEDRVLSQVDSAIGGAGR